MKWGLVIQGPSSSRGGSRFKEAEYDCSESVAATLKIASKYFDEIVVSGWHGDIYAEDNWPPSVKKVLSPVPDFDKGNLRKQFISTLAGLEVLKAANVAFVVKVRTDQVLPEQAFRDIRSRFDNTDNSSRLMLSDYVETQPFYAGDFVFAGSIDVVVSWARAVLAFGAKDLHLSLGKDYVLKYLCASDPRFPNFLNPLFPAIFQTADPRNLRLLQYWRDQRKFRFDFLRRRDFSDILWRGERMSEIVNVDIFSFREENDDEGEQRVIGEARPTLFASLGAIWADITLEIRILEDVHNKSFRHQFWKGALRGEWSAPE